MRIIAGKYKGKVLNEFELDTTRPTSDMVRGAIFNMIGSSIQDAQFLDLFAGTGAVGIEALSRGAKQVVFVDFNHDSINLIRRNLKLVNLGNYNFVHQTSFDVALQNCANNNNKFDIIFLDPPYKTNLAEQAIKQIFELDLLNPFGKIFWEHDETKLPLLNNAFVSLKSKKYGKKFVTIIEKQNLTKFINMQNVE